MLNNEILIIFVTFIKVNFIMQKENVKRKQIIHLIQKKNKDGNILK